MDVALLEYEMKKSKVSKDDLAKNLGISRSALYRKFNGVTEFTLGEIRKIVELLNLDSPDAIFFNN